METTIMVVVIGAMIGLLVMMVKYANHIHHFPKKQNPTDEKKPSEPANNKTENQ